MLNLILAAALLWPGGQSAPAAQPAPAPVPRISPDADPACASPAPPPLTAEQIAAYRARSGQPKPPLPPASDPNPIRTGAVPKHECFLAVAKRGGIDLLFVGDSITDFFGRADRGAEVWKARYGKRRAANFGISGDTTQDVLWRMRNGELDGFSARVIVLMIGTNNIGRNANADIAAGDAAIVAEFRKRQPKAKVLLLGVFPRGNDPKGPARANVAEINAGLARLADGKSVFYLDLAPAFLNPDGTLVEGAMADGLHPSPKGYQLWADAMEPMLQRLMH